MTHPQFTPDNIDRFWSRVDQSNGPQSCWPWQGSRFSDGYGAFGLRYKTLKASRVAFYLTHGFWPQLACHRCDNPSCCNPDHIYDGSHADNTRDMVERGRVCRTSGEDRWTSKLTNDQVMEIRRRYADGETQEVIAPDFGITFQNVSWIVNGKSWSHLPLIPLRVRRLTHPHSAETIAAVKHLRETTTMGYGRVVSTLGIGKTTVARIVRGGR